MSDAGFSFGRELFFVPHGKTSGVKWAKQNLKRD